MDPASLGRLLSRGELLGGESADPPPTDILGRIGGYDLLEEIGRGGMGVVYRARQRALDRVVALKVILGGASIPPESIARFLREAQAAGRVEHPHIVPVFDVGEADGRHYFSMQLVEGPTLQSVLQQGVLTVPRVLDLVRKVALALHAVHERGIIHRDVKPSNILLGPDGEPRLADFGISRFETASPGSTTGTCIGSPWYASPEQMAGGGAPIDRRTDVFSLGATLYQALTGKPPFVRDNVFLGMQAILDPEVAPNPITRSDAGNGVKAICLKALSKVPADRYATALEMAEDLERAERGESVAAAPTPLPVRWRRWAARRRLPLLLAAATAAAVAVVLLGPIVRRTRATAAARERLEAAAMSADPGERRAALAAARDLLLQYADPQGAEVRRIEAEIAAIDRAAWEARAASIAREREATRVLEKSTAVGRVLGRWARLGPSVRELDRLRQEPGLSAEARSRRAAAPLGELATFLEQTPGDPASQATARALAAWATYLVGDRDPAVTAMRAASSLDSEVPFGAMVESLVLIDGWVRQVRLPQLAVSTLGRCLVEVEDQDALSPEDQARLAELLRAIDAAAVWGPDEAADLRRAIEGVRAIHERDFEAAEAALSGAVVAPGLAPFRPTICLLRAKVRFFLGWYEDCRKDVEAVLADLPGLPEAAFFDAEAAYALGVEAHVLGRDPRPWWDEALRTYDALLRRGIQPVTVRVNRSRIWFWTGEALARSGGDRIAAYDRAIEDLEAARASNPADAASAYSLGLAWCRKGEALAAEGRDPGEAFERAQSSLGAAIDLSPTMAVARSARAALLTTMASRTGRERATALCRQAIEDCDRALALSRGDAPALLHRAQARRQLAALLGPEGGDVLMAAIVDLDEVLRITPSGVLALQSRGSAWGCVAQSRPAGGPEAEEAWTRALADLDRAIALLPSDPNAWFNRGLMRQWRAADLASRGLDPRKAFEDALQDLSEAVGRNPRIGRAWYQRALTRLMQAEVMAKNHEDPLPVLELAVEDAGRAVSLSPTRPDWLTLRGNAQLELGDALARAGRDAAKAFDGALADFRGAIEAAPQSWTAWWGEGRVRMRKGETAKGLEALERASALAGAPPAALTADVQAAREAAAGQGR